MILNYSNLARTYVMFECLEYLAAHALHRNVHDTQAGDGQISRVPQGAVGQDLRSVFICTRNSSMLNSSECQRSHIWM